MSETVIGLLRHGQTDWNIDFRLQGVTDIPLNETGIQQAREVAGLIRAQDWDVLLSSPLSRARDTANIVGATSGLPATRVENLLLERSFGEAEGLTHEQWRANYASLDRLPGGESLEELTERAWKLLDHLSQEFQGLRVLAVTHGALIRKLIRMVSEGELPLDGQRFANASLSTIVHDGENWSIRNFNPHTYSGWAI